MPIGIDPAAATIPLASTFQPVSQTDAMGDAYALAGQKQNVQIRQGVIDQQKQQLQDKQQMQEYLKAGGDFYSQEGLDKAVGDLKGKVSPDAYMSLVEKGKTFQQDQANLETKLAQLPVQQAAAIEAKTNMTLQSLAPIYDAYETGWQNRLKAKGMDPANAPAAEVEQAKKEATADFQAAKQARLQQFQQQTVGGKPVVDQQFLQQYEQLGPDETRTAIQHGKYFQDRMKAAQDIRYKDSEIKKNDALAKVAEQGKELTSLNQINDALKNPDLSPDERTAMEDLRKKLTTKGTQAEATLSDGDATAMAKRIAAGEKGVLSGVGRGAQGSANIIKVQKALSDMNLPPDAIARAQSEVSAAGAGLRAVATRQARLDTAVIEVNKFADNALESMEHVSRGDVVPVNEILAKIKKGAGSPEEVEFATYVQSLANAYASVVNRGAPTTVTSLEEAGKIINGSFSKAQFKAMINAIKKESTAAQESSVGAGENIKKESFPQSSASTDPNRASPDVQKKRDDDAVRTLQDELTNAQNMVKTAKPGSPEATEAKDSVDGLTKELKNHGVTVSPPKTTAKAANPEDAKALAWAKVNPNDPRAKKIMSIAGQ